MRKLNMVLVGLGLLNLGLFTVMFWAFQQENIYHTTLGKISRNYERVGTWDQYEIKEISTPYVAIENDRFNTWDAGIYRCIKEKMYHTDEGCYHHVRGAFFPLFPLAWKILDVNNIAISLYNYFAFFISVILLMHCFIKGSLGQQSLLFGLMIALPSSIIFYIPYSESAFMLTMSIAVWSMIKKKYYLFVIAIVLLAMVRPATIFLCAAFITADTLQFLRHKNIRHYFREIFLKLWPFILGYAAAIFIQFIYSSSWTTLIDAHAYWQGGGIQSIKKITDWSVEGYGLSVFSVFFICIPAIVYISREIFRPNVVSPAQGNIFHYSGNAKYIQWVAALYITGIFIFTILTSGGNLHSFFRFTLATPPFYILIMLFYHAIEKKALPFKISLVILPILAVFLFLWFVPYGGEKLRFNYMGLFLSAAIYTYIVFRPHLSTRVQYAFTIGLILCCTIWNTFLMNIFLSDGWIFT